MLWRGSGRDGPGRARRQLCRKSNAILDLSPCPWTLILDDDISRIGLWEDGGHRWLTPDELWEVMVQGFILAADFGVKLWGIQQNKDEGGHDTFQPFNLLAPILGPFNGHLEPVLRYDESVLGKDDYDFWLQNIRLHRRTLRQMPTIMPTTTARRGGALSACGRWQQSAPASTGCAPNGAGSSGQADPQGADRDGQEHPE